MGLDESRLLLAPLVDSNLRPTSAIFSYLAGNSNRPVNEPPLNRTKQLPSFRRRQIPDKPGARMYRNDLLPRCQSALRSAPSPAPRPHQRKQDDQAPQTPHPQPYCDSRAGGNPANAKPQEENS